MSMVGSICLGCRNPKTCKPAMGYVLAALGLLVATLYALRGGLVGPRGPVHFSGFDPNAIVLGVLAVAAAVYVFGPTFGIALMLAIMIHEFGHVAAYRVCGHADARFRLIPLIGGVAISNQLPASQEKDFFITLMGPAICLAPMILSLALLQIDGIARSEACGFLATFAAVTGAINALNLMPFWPLDGGRCVTTLVRTFLPGATVQAMMAMVAATIVLAIYSRSIVLMVFALMAAQNLIQRGDVGASQRPMSKGRGLIALAAYLATFAAFVLSGWPLLARFF